MSSWSALIVQPGRRVDLFVSICKVILRLANILILYLPFPTFGTNSTPFHASGTCPVVRLAVVSLKRISTISFSSCCIRTGEIPSDPVAVYGLKLSREHLTLLAEAVVPRPG